MFSIFKKQPKDNDPLREETRDMKCRRINFVDDDYDGLIRDMDTDCKSLLRLKPVNYYATKASYITGVLYTSKDMSDALIEFLHIEGEKQTAHSRLYPIDKETASKLLAKVGIMTN